MKKQGTSTVDERWKMMMYDSEIEQQRHQLRRIGDKNYYHDDADV